MGASIVDIQNMGDALRNTGYKNIESAVAEIIDNSVEANAKNIFLILREGIATSGRKVVTEIGFLDNGDGMSLNVLGSCLGIGASTRKARKGMGRFGVGLPQASLYACPEIEVYSWQTGVENAHKVYLDINKIKDGEQKEIEDPALTQIPDPYASYLHYQTLSEKYDFSKSGTWDVNIVSESSKDLFGIRTLDFRFDVSNGEEPDFLTADITDYIECRPFLASEYDEKPYMPGQRYDDKLDDYCFATPGIYLIPLYLLVGSGSKDDKLRKKRFITMSGITPLLQTLKELEKKNIPGEILTTNYLNFSEPRALKKLNELQNITLKMYDVEAAKEGFHTKGYIFKKEEIYRIIIGSSNITSAALTYNREWNTKIVSTEDGEMAREIVQEFDSLWNSKYALDFDTFYESYREKYKIIKHQRDVAKLDDITSIEKYKLEPNSMQVGFIKNLRKIQEAGERKALLISATGTGKTYASAFAMRELGFQRVLFLVHRNQIAKQAKKSFRKVFSGQVSMGLVTGKYQEYDKDFIFATIQTLSKEENLHRYEKNAFDAIVIDEAHHSAANSYKKVLDYFEPKLWLGMTATPDKRDDNLEGRNIYEIFNHQIAYEIRLQDAMEEDLLCPFHYFGITDLDIIADAGKSSGEKVENFRYLISEERVENVMKQAEYFGYSGDRVKGLIFCSRIDEAKELSKKFNDKGWRTLVLSGSDSEEARAAAIERLAGEESEDALDYIISVDIFSEGVDVPEINQVIMLRPTESPIVFIQQLGRGLRKAENKEYVVVLDFIGNYRNNFMIPIALSGDRSYNKDNIRRYVTEGGRVIPGASTIHFDEISRKRIFQAIDNANFSDIKLIRENYTNLKNKLGHIPALADFDKYGEMDVLRIFDNNSLGSYYKFLVKYEKEYTIRLSEDEEKAIEFISKKLASGKRIHELELLKRTLQYRHGIIERLRKYLSKKYHCEMDEHCTENVINMMTNEFPTSAAKKTYA